MKINFKNLALATMVGLLPVASFATSDVVKTILIAPQGVKISDYVLSNNGVAQVLSPTDPQSGAGEPLYAKNLRGGLYLLGALVSAPVVDRPIKTILVINQRAVLLAPGAAKPQLSHRLKSENGGSYKMIDAPAAPANSLEVYTTGAAGDITLASVKAVPQA